DLSATLVLVTSGTVGSPQLDVDVTASVTGNADFTADNTVTWMAGDAPSTKQIAVTAVDDKSVEQTVETFSGLAAGLTTTAITGAGATGTVAVTDNDSLKVDLGPASPTRRSTDPDLSATLVLVTSGTVG